MLSFKANSDHQNITNESQQSNEPEGFHMGYDSIKEYLLSWVGMDKESSARKLYEKGGEYLVSELAEESLTNGKGYASVKIPLAFVPEILGGSPIKYITVITDPKLAKVIGNYGVGQLTYDRKSRLPYYITKIIMRSDNIVARNDSKVKKDRSNMKQIMHDFDRIFEIAENQFTKWAENNCINNRSKGVNLEETLKKTIIKTLGRTLLGIDKFPKSEYFTKMINILDDLDESMTLFDIQGTKKYESEMLPYSEWIYEHNWETMESNRTSILPHLIGDNIHPDKVNIANAFLVTPNITKLIYLSVIFFATEPDWQEKLREAMINEDQETINNIYKELCRLYIPTNIPRFASRKTEFNGVEFPENTMFYILGRAIRMNSDTFEDPERFNPDRFKDKDIKMNSIELSPFGIGVRQCPASSQFTDKFWKFVMKTIFTNYKVEVRDNTQKLESIPINARFIKLNNQYIGKITKL